MIITVTLNPAIDRTVVLDKFNHGAVNRIKNVRVDMGGKGINVAKILCGLGEEVKAIGFMGRHNQKQVEYLLQQQNFDTEFVYIDAPTRVNTKVVELERSITTDLNEPGFLVSSEYLKKIMDLLEKYSKQCDYIIFSGSVPRGASQKTYYEMIEKLKKKTNVVLDAENDLLLYGLQANPNIIKPNIHEMEAAIGKKLRTDDEIIEAGLDWIEKYNIQYVLVSMGSQGSLLITNDSVYKALPIEVQVKGTVGAGDSMLAGFIHGLRKGNIESALAYGAACGTLAVGKEGTETFGTKEVETMLSRVQLQKIR